MEMVACAVGEWAGGRAIWVGEAERVRRGRERWQQAHHTHPTLESVIASELPGMGMSAFHHSAPAPIAPCRWRAEFRPSGGDKMA